MTKKDLLAAVGEVENEISGTLLEWRQWAATHAHAGVPHPAGIVTRLDLAQVTAMTAAQFFSVDLEKEDKNHLTEIFIIHGDE